MKDAATLFQYNVTRASTNTEQAQKNSRLRLNTSKKQKHYNQTQIQTQVQKHYGKENNKSKTKYTEKSKNNTDKLKHASNNKNVSQIKTKKEERQRRNIYKIENLLSAHFTRAPTGHTGGSALNQLAVQICKAGYTTRIAKNENEK